jgi:hypothetical protein
VVLNDRNSDYDLGGPGYTIDSIRNELISRGVIKGKYSKKTLKLRIARPEELSAEQLNFINNGLKKGVVYLFLIYDDEISKTKGPPSLTYRRDIINDLEEAIKPLRNGPSEGIAIYWRQIDEYLREISRAVSAGLLWHPLVYDIIYAHKALGNKEILRRIKRGWETGVRRPIKTNDIKFESYLDKIAKYRDKGKTWKEIRRTLMKCKIIRKMTEPGLIKKYKRACEETKPPPHLPSIVLMYPLPFLGPFNYLPFALWTS